MPTHSLYRASSVGSQETLSAACPDVDDTSNPISTLSSLVREFVWTVQATSPAMAEEPPTKRKCLGADCENDAGSLQCPTCLKLGVKDSFFCSQDCFKRNWVSLSALGNSLWVTSADRNDYIFRAHTRQCTSRRTVLSTPSFRQK